jgi:hypothetical protein
MRKCDHSTDPPEQADNLTKDSDFTTLGIYKGMIRFFLVGTLIILFLYLLIEKPGENLPDSLIVSLVFILGYWGISEEVLPDRFKSPRKILDPSMKNVVKIIPPLEELYTDFKAKIEMTMDSVQKVILDLHNELKVKIEDVGNIKNDLDGIKARLENDITSLEKLQSKQNQCITISQKSELEICSNFNRIYIIVLSSISCILILGSDIYKPLLENVSLSIPDFIYATIMILIGVEISGIITNYAISHRANEIYEHLGVDVIESTHRYIKIIENMQVTLGKRISKAEDLSELFDSLYSDLEKMRKDFNTFLDEFNIIEIVPPHIFSSLLVITVGFFFINMNALFISEIGVEEFLLFLEVCVAAYFVRK